MIDIRMHVQLMRRRPHRVYFPPLYYDYSVLGLGIPCRDYILPQAFIPFLGEAMFLYLS